jgi:type IV pilus assembly protein PilA
MLEFFRKRMKDDRGFTLIELMVVVLIIAILIAIAIPTFLGLRRRAQDRAAQSDLRNGLTAAKAYFTDADSYNPTGAEVFNAAEGTLIEPSLKWVDGGAALVGQVHVKAVSADGVTPSFVVLSTRSASGDYFCIADSSDAGTGRGRVDAATVAACTGGW